MPMNIGYVYAIEWSDGLVKIGSSRHPKIRIDSQHRKNLNKTKTWISPVIIRPLLVERLSQRLLDYSRQGISELFAVDFALSVWILEGYCKTTIADVPSKIPRRSSPSPRRGTLFPPPRRASTGRSSERLPGRATAPSRGCI